MQPIPISKLSRIDLVLFNIYLLLVIVGAAGIVYGSMVIIYAFLQLPTTPVTPIWQTMLCILISGLMIKIFLREMLILKGIKKIVPSVPFEDGIKEIEDTSPTENKVLPFRRPVTKKDDH